MTHYDTLGVPRNATRAQIDAAFQSLRETYNSDKHPDPPSAAKQLRWAVHAYRVLSNPTTRKDYDQQLTRAETPLVDPAISTGEFKSWVDSGTVSESLAAKIQSSSGHPQRLERPSTGIDWGSVYLVGYWITWALVFVGCWIYCIASYGFLLGVGLGWLPSGIAAFVISIFWPLILLLAIALILYIAAH